MKLNATQQSVCLCLYRSVRSSALTLLWQNSLHHLGESQRSKVSAVDSLNKQMITSSINCTGILNAFRLNFIDPAVFFILKCFWLQVLYRCVCVVTVEFSPRHCGKAAGRGASEQPNQCPLRWNQSIQPPPVSPVQLREPHCVLGACWQLRRSN